MTPALPYAYVVVVSRDGPLAEPMFDGITRHPYTADGGSAFLTRASWPRTARLVREELLADPGSAVFALVDFHAVELYASSPDPPPPHVGKQLLSALGIARWLTGGPTW